MNAGAWSTAASGAPTQSVAQTSIVKRNQPPLHPGGAAGIREAQGASDRGILIASGLILASIVAALLLIEDEDGTVATGTN